MFTARLKELDSAKREALLERSKVDVSRVRGDVEGILEDVYENGDRALRRYTEQFDGVRLDDLKVSEREFKEALASVEPEFLVALKEARGNIEDFHRKQSQGGWEHEKDGIKLGQLVRPIGSVGCYIPGGRASYPSTVLMTVIPAVVAGVERIVCVSPPGKDGKVNRYVLAACRTAGIGEVYKVGGAQAIGALAFGTESVPRVDKIFGPGNIYVTAAKIEVSRSVAVDMPAGPSEVLIVADGSAEVEFIAWDMVAQAEHDENAIAVLVTSSEKLASEVKKRIEGIEKNKAAEEALDRNGGILITNSVEEAIEFANDYAPEHLVICTEDARKMLAEVKNAGSVFLGSYSPVACGDYASGTNHVLPTMGFARSYSGLSVHDFVKFISYQEIGKGGLKRLEKTVTTLAEREGLEAHAESVKKRTGK